MKIPKFILKRLQNYSEKESASRPPDFHVGTKYLKRWWIIPRNAFFNIYLHHFSASDDDRALHDHMYVNLSILLKGSYIEHTLGGQFYRSAGDTKARLPQTLHRIEIPNKDEGCWTLFITGPRVRSWGFQIGPVVRNWLGFKTKQNWLYHEDFIAKYGEQLNH